MLGQASQEAIRAAKFDPRPIKELIEHLHYTPAEFARVLGTSTVNVSRWLAGRPPAGDFMIRIWALAKATRSDFDFIEGIRRPPPPL